MKSALEIEEQETHITWSRGAERAKIYASDMTTMTKLDKLAAMPKSEWKLEKEEITDKGEMVGKFYTCPVPFVSFRSKASSRVFSDEERKQQSERMKELHKINFKGSN